MAKSKSTVKKVPKAKRVPASSKGPISYKPGRGLVVSMTERWPKSADEMVTCAKSIVQAVIAAHDSGGLDDENYDVHWPLSVAVDLLEHAANGAAKAVSHGR